MRPLSKYHSSIDLAPGWTWRTWAGRPCRSSCQRFGSPLGVKVWWHMFLAKESSKFWVKSEQKKTVNAVKLVSNMWILSHFSHVTFWLPLTCRFAQDNGKQIMEMYCDQDILILMVNAPFIVRLVLAFATSFMAKRQPLSSCIALCFGKRRWNWDQRKYSQGLGLEHLQTYSNSPEVLQPRSNRIKVFSSATSADCQKILRAIGPPSMFPATLGGAVRKNFSDRWSDKTYYNMSILGMITIKLSNYM